MNKIIFFCLICSLTYSAHAQHFESTGQQTVIELFTSEGCSSCPPADHWLASFKSHPQLFKTLFPIAYHVDYWNQLGWFDRFSSPRHSQRQRLYQRQGLVRQVYTPGVLVNGEEWRGWFRQQELMIDKLDSGRLSVDINQNKLHASYSGGEDIKWVLNIAYLGMGLSSKIDSGENSGKQLSHEFVVLAHRNLSGRDTWTMTLPPIPSVGQTQTAIVIWLSNMNQLKPRHMVGGILE